MTDWLDILQRDFPVRRTAAQRTACRAFLTETLREMGCHPREEENGRLRQRSLVVGDPESAALLVVAHIDTPAWSPLPQTQFPRRWPVYILYLTAQILLALIPALLMYMLFYQLTGSARAGLWALVVTYLALLLAVRFGPANRHNANSSTGLAAALSLLEALPPEKRGRVAVLLTDGGTMGHLGAKAWAKAHPQVQYTRLTVGLDWLGVGDRLLCVSSALADRSTGIGALRKALAAVPGLTLTPVSARASTLPGDFRAFRCGVGLCACRRHPLWGDFIPALQTARDTVADGAQVQAVASALAEVAGRL